MILSRVVFVALGIVLQLREFQTLAFATVGAPTRRRVVLIASSSGAIRKRMKEGNDDGEEMPTNKAELLELPEKDSEEEEAEEGTFASDGEDDFALQKSKWKKKRYFMMKDVQDAVRRNDNSALKKAEDMMERWWHLFDKSGRQEMYRPSVQAYNLWLHAWAKSGRPDAGIQAERILQQEMKPHVLPDSISYATVMDAYARQSKHDPSAAEQAERVLFELMEQSELLSGAQLKVTPVTYDTVLNAWARQGTWEGAERAEQILKRLEAVGRQDIRPTAHSYATVINAWAGCSGGGEAAARAQSVLEGMMALKMVEPDSVIFNSSIQAWASSRDPRSGSKALQLLQQMKDLSKQGHDCQPDTVTYNIILSAWSHSGHINAASQAEKVLQEMVTAHREDPDSAPAPTTTSYNNVLHAWSKSSAPAAAQRARNILEFMIKSDNKDIAPDVYSFGSVLDALAKSKEPDKASQAWSLLNTMLDMYDATKKTSLKPTTVPFNTVVNAAAFSAIGTTDEQRKEALKVAVQTFTLMRNSGVSPSTLSYGFMLKCFTNIMDAGQVRTDMALSVFDKCREEGLVGDMVWKEIRRAVPYQTLREKYNLPPRPVETLQVRDLPRAGSRSLPGRYRPRKQAPKRRSRKEREKARAPKARASAQRFRNISETSYQSGRDI
jgi:hypothetical protein